MREPKFRLRAGVLALGCLALGGCSEDPSFVVRWSLDGEALSESPQCSRLGVLNVAALTYDALGRLVDVRRFPCFPGSFRDPEGRVTGPTLPEGPYAVQIVGTNRAFAVWTDEATLLQEQVAAELQGKSYSDPEFETCTALAASPACRPEALVCDCKHVDVRDGATIDLGVFELGPTPQCSDGIDNDLDGLVDGNDAACGELFSLDTLEGRNVAATEFDLRISLFEGNPAVSCRDLGIARLEVRLGDDVLASTTSCDLDQRFSATIDETKADGPAVDGHWPITLTVHALDAQGEALTEPRVIAVEVPEAFGGFFVLQADFPAASFLAPIESTAWFSVQYVPSEGASGRFCEPTAPSGGGRLTIDSVRLALLDAHGRPLDPPVALDDGTLADGSARPCRAAALFTNTPLKWGEYLVAVQGLSPAGDVCFSNVDAPSRAAPGDQFVVSVPRVSASGSCADCDADSDCATGWICDDGVCRR